MRTSVEVWLPDLEIAYPFEKSKQFLKRMVLYARRVYAGERSHSGGVGRVCAGELGGDGVELAGGKTC